MNETNQNQTLEEENQGPQTTADQDAASNSLPPQTTHESIPSMAEFESEINRSFKKLKEGDIVKGTVIGISDTQVTLDLNYFSEGIIKLEELSNDPRFSIKADIAMGEEISATVIGEDNEGNLLLSRKKADDILAWDALREMMNTRSIATIKVAEAVKAGVVTYLNGIRAFIPASKLALEYVEDLNSYVGKELEVLVVTVEPEKKKLVLSAKDVLRDRAEEEKKNRISQMQIGLITTGTVEKIMPFGAFVNIGNGVSGLVHISQICGKRIKSPNEVIKEGDTVTVKIIGLKDGKLSFSMKEAKEQQEKVVEDISKVPTEYKSGGNATTGLGALLKNIKLDQ